MIFTVEETTLIAVFDHSSRSTADARHRDTYVLKVFEEHADTLAELFN